MLLNKLPILRVICTYLTMLTCIRGPLRAIGRGAAIIGELRASDRIDQLSKLRAASRTRQSMEKYAIAFSIWTISRSLIRNTSTAGST